MSAPSAGAETSTRLAPACRCAAALSLAVKMPVHSSATSIPSSFQGSWVGSLMAVTLMAPLPQVMVSPFTVTSPGKRPCTESKRSRCALVSTGARSLMARISMSLRPASTAARRMLRPMRPNPLIATRTDITQSPYDFLQTRQRRLCHLLGGNAKMLVKLFVGPTRAKPAQAHKSSVGADNLVPALADAGFDADLYRRIADDCFALRRRCGKQQLHARHRDDAHRHALCGQKLLR